MSSSTEPQPSSPHSALIELLGCFEEMERRQKTNRLAEYRPYTKQADFHAAGEAYRERLLRAGNQLGKTVAGASEVAFHLTGRYPDWWRGRRWDRPVVGWVAGPTGETTRDNPQRLLMGRPDSWGTGTIPADDIVDHSRAHGGVTDLLDTIIVQHITGGTSYLKLKNYQQGREKWQGETLDFVWFDEEPPADIYSEGLTRTNATGGMAWLTFTPLLGMSEVVRRFLIDPTADRHDTNMTIDDAEHIPPEERDRIIASYPPHEREARAKGVPVLGSGRIFPVAESAISVPAFKLPDHWPQLGAMDFGWDHPFAAVRVAYDREADCMYVTDAYRVREQTPVIHAAALKVWGDWLRWAWPHDGLQHSKDSGVPLATQYRRQGLRMLADHARYADGSAGVEAGLMDMLDRMQTGRLKVFAHLADWFEEFRLYHRKDGKVVKEHEDLMAATRYGAMSLRLAATKIEVVRPRFERTVAEELTAHLKGAASERGDRI